jgi:phage gpG-like protein
MGLEFVKAAVFRERLARIGTAAFRNELARRVGYGALKLIAQSFDKGADPYGRPWRFVAWHPGHKKRLWDTGDLRAGFMAYPYAMGVKILNSIPYASVHQYGAPKANIPARPMLPNTQEGLPYSWLQMIQKEYTLLAKQWMAGG